VLALGGLLGWPGASRRLTLAVAQDKADSATCADLTNNSTPLAYQFGYGMLRQAEAMKRLKEIERLSPR
jgi:hypothetical protein